MPKVPSIPGRLLRVKAAAQYIALSPWKIRDMVQSGQLPVIQYGENAPWLIDVRDLDEWVESNKTRM